MQEINAKRMTCTAKHTVLSADRLCSHGRAVLADAVGQYDCMCTA